MTLDANGKYVIERVVVHQRAVVVPPPLPIPWADQLDNESARWPWDADVKAGKTLAVDCELLPGGKRYGEQEDSGEEEAGEDGESDFSHVRRD